MNKKRLKNYFSSWKNGSVTENLILKLIDVSIIVISCQMATIFSSSTSLQWTSKIIRILRDWDG